MNYGIGRAKVMRSQVWRWSECRWLSTLRNYFLANKAEIFFYVERQQMLRIDFLDNERTSLVNVKSYKV